VKVVYVCGYGRSGSTLLGRLLAADQAAVAVGEVTHVDSAAFLEHAVCSCGRRYPTCDYWAEVDRRLAAVGRDRPALGQRRRQLLEGWLGLAVPIVALKRTVGRCAFSERYPSVTFEDGVRTLADVGGSVVVDVSKTTRLTANRPRLLFASGLSVQLHLSGRPLREVIESYRAAHRRRGIELSGRRAATVVMIGRLSAHLAARWCARSLAVKLRRSNLFETSTRAAESQGSDACAHMIAGNRSRHLSMVGGRGAP